MQKYVWSSEYSVGHAEMDEQHKSMLDMINELINAIESDATPETAREMLTKVTDYACSHLVCEEEHLRRWNFPHFDRHKAKHDEFRKKNGELHLLINQMGPEVLGEILVYLGDWWKDHILESDMNYKEFIQD